MRTVLTSLFLLLAACGTDMDPGSTIERVRVLGARVEVDGDTGRASPMPGETARVTWVLASPDAMPTLSWAMGACVADAAMVGCAGDPYLVETGSGGTPAITVSAPTAEELGDARGLLVIGVICAGGTPEVNGYDTRCAGDDAAVKTDVRLSIRVGDANRSPRLASDAIHLGDVAWNDLDPANEPALEGCAADAQALGIPLVSAAAVNATKDKALVVYVATKGSDREAFDDVQPDGQTLPTREELQISHFTTAGELDHQFEIIEADDTTEAPVTEVEWKAPEGEDLKALSAAGLRVRFTFVMRDGRGGLDATGRVMCLVP